METGKPPPSRPVVSAGAGQDDHLSEIISHILEPIVKMRPGGMEMTSTGAFIALVDGINQMVIPIEDINLDEVDYHLDSQEKEAQEKYDKFEDEMAQGLDKNDLPEGWNLENSNKNYNFTEGHDVPEGWKVKAGKQRGKTVPSPETRRLEILSTAGMIILELQTVLEMRWKDSEYRVVLDKMKLSKSCPEESMPIMEAIWSWMAEHEVITLVEVGEDILDGLEAMLVEESSGVSEDVLMDATEVITAILVARGLETSRLAPIFQKDGRSMTEKISRIGRAVGMIRMREEMTKVKNQRVKPNSRDYNTTDFDDMKVQRKRRRDCTNRMETGILRSDMVTNRMVQDKGNKIQVVGSDVKALYPSLEAVELADIVYEAVLKV